MEDFKNISTGLDIGSSKVVMAVGRKNQNGKISVLAVKQASYNKDVVNTGTALNVVEINKAIENVLKAVNDTLDSITVERAVVGLSGKGIRCEKNQQYKDLKNETITQQHIDTLKAQAEQTSISPGEIIIEAVAQRYFDVNTEIKKPVGTIINSRFTIDFLLIIVDKQALDNIRLCLRDLTLQEEKVCVNSFAFPLAVLEEKDIEQNVAVVDIGCAITDLSIFSNGVIRHIDCNNLGGKYITNSIKEKYHVSYEDAELLKIKYGSAYPPNQQNTDIVDIQNVNHQKPKAIPIKELSEIISKGMVKITKWIWNEMRNYEKSNGVRLSSIFFTGGGSKINDFESFLKCKFGIDVVANPGIYLSDESKDKITAEHATALGLLMVDLENQKKYTDIFEHSEHIVQKPFPPQKKETQQVKKSFSIYNRVLNITKNIKHFFLDDIENEKHNLL